MTFDGSVTLIRGMFTRIYNVFISIHTFFRETPRKAERIKFVETAPVIAIPAFSTTDWRRSVPSNYINMLNLTCIL
jgi:hypothetical protein